MSFEHKITMGVAIDGGDGHVMSQAYTAESKQSYEVAVPDSTTDKEVTLAITHAQLTSLYMSSDQDMTVETNNASAPGDTINLKANVPMIWNEDSYFTNPVNSADVTKVFLTNASGSAATFRCEVLQDATP